MRKHLLILVAFIVGRLCGAEGIPLTESTFTEIVKEASVLTETDKIGKPAKTSEVFRIPDLVRTGDQSRVELTAKDQTITRIGSNTTFTFAQGGRDVILKKGGVLFHSPKGAGGGSVNYRGSSAAVLGTTEIAQVMLNGRYKVINLEGLVKVTLHNGAFVFLKPGQLVIVSADGTTFGSVLNFNLGELASHLLLVVGFSHPVASNSLIAAAIAYQNQQIASGAITIDLSWLEAAEGLDFVSGGVNDSSFYFIPIFNPLDFPGQGIGPSPGGSPVLVPNVIPTINAPNIDPPVMTAVNPPDSSGVGVVSISGGASSGLNVTRIPTIKP